MKYLHKSTKSLHIIELIEKAIDLLIQVKIPLEEKTPRAIEKMAMSFLAVAGISSKISETKGYEEGRIVKTREVIEFINTHFEENISQGSYDDIRRKDLKLLVLAGYVWNCAENPNAATNDPTRGYALSPSFAKLVRLYDEKSLWEEQLNIFLAENINLKELIARQREVALLPVILPNGEEIVLSTGKHNELQQAIINDFLPRFGMNCEVLYVGDTSKKILYLQKEMLEQLRFFQLDHDKLPDILAYNKQKNWLYLIEAVHSSGPISETRRLELKQLTSNCTAEIIFITTFLTKSDFRKWANEIAWETEVWIAESPDHLIHFNGDKFLGPYTS